MDIKSNNNKIKYNNFDKIILHRASHFKEK